MTEKERLRLGVVRMSLVLVCMVLPLMMIWGFPKKSSSSEKELTPTPTESTGATPGPLGNVEKKVLWSLYAKIFPEDSVVKESSGNSGSRFAARLEISAEEWKKAKAELTKRGWNQEGVSTSVFPVGFIGELFSGEERDRLIDSWSLVHYVALPEYRSVKEGIWVMQGENENTVLVLYWVYVNAG